MKKKMINNRGASLIEVLVSMVLLAVGLLGAVCFSRIGSQALSYGDRIAKVSALAQAKLESKLGQSYKDLIAADADSVIEDGIKLDWEINRDNPFTDIVTIEVIARWKDGKGIEKRISFVGAKSNQIMSDEFPLKD